MNRFRLSDQACSDLEDLWLYIAMDNPSAADRMIDEVISKFELLAVQPGMGRSREELAEALRSFPVGNYVIFYRPMRDGIEIVRVLSGYRDLGPLFDD